MFSHPSVTMQELRRLDTSSPIFQYQLSDFLDGEEYVRYASGLKGDDLVWLIDYLDEALNHLDSSSPVSQRCRHELRTICGARAVLPTSYTLLSRQLNTDSLPFASGGYGDVYQGTLDGTKVCVKRVRVYTQDILQKAAKTFCKEAVVWKHLAHPNIVPLLAITVTPFQLISGWMPGGDIPNYTRNNPNADRVRLLSDVVEGLRYLHSCSVIHGDLKGANVLVDGAGRARITDFCLTVVTTDVDSNLSASLLHRNTQQWTAPEVLNGGKYSKKSDIFSLAMVTTELFTDAVPFGALSSFMVMLAITQGKRPPRPTHPTFTENLWKLTQRCWDNDPHLRPEASEVFKALRTPDLPSWKRLIVYPLSIDERTSLITSILSDRGEAQAVGHLSGGDAQAFIDVVYEVLDGLAPQIRRRCLHSMRRICGRQALLPSSLPIPLCYDPKEPPQYRGGFADVWRGLYEGRSVAAKALKVHSTSDLGRIKKGFCKGVLTWKTLHHPNVLPLLGVTMTQNQFVLVSEWMDGNINTFVKTHPNANPLKLLADVTRGLIYVHDQGAVHGDLKGSNILIDDVGRACLSDFGLRPTISDQETLLSMSIEGGTIPWMSPELLDPESFGSKKGRPTRASDCYALGMLIYEVLSGRAPFAPSKAPIFKILRGDRPSRPQTAKGALFTDGIWKTLELCWKAQPRERINAKTVLPSLDGTPLWPPSPNMEGDTDTDVFSNTTDSRTRTSPPAG